MKFFIISDTHGRIDKAVEIYKKLKDVDMIVHLGDLQKDALALGDLLGVDVISVKGNVDGSHSREDHEILHTEFGKILLVHGHMEHVKASLQNLLYRAEELECKAAFYGHTHEAYFGHIGGIYLLNPGSLTRPVIQGRASYAIATTKKDEFNASIVYYDTVADKNSSFSKVEGGYLKNLLNNSDRF